jgi:hypothetical protein
LHLACINNAPLEVVQYLVEKWPEAVMTTTDGSLPLHYACYNKAPLEVIQYLVEQWPKSVMTTMDEDGKLPLHVACRYTAPLEVIQYLVKQWPEAVKTKLVSGSLPLHLACRFKAPLEEVQFLVEQWPEAVKTTDVSGKTPLGYAQNPDARFGRSIPEVIAWLLDVEAGRISFEILSKQLPVPTPSKPEPEPNLEHDIASKFAMLDCYDSLVFLSTQIAHMRRFSLWFSLRNRTTAKCMQ